MKDQILHIFTKQFFFESPSHYSSFMITLTVIFSVLIIAGAGIALLMKDETKKIFGRYVKPFLIVGILGLLHVFARYERLAWFNTRFFATVLFVALFIWLFVLALGLSKYLPEYKKKKEVAARYEKYLPKNSQKNKAQGQKTR